MFIVLLAEKMSFLQEYKGKLVKFLDQPKGQNPFVDLLIKLEEKSGLPRLYIVLPVLGVCLLVFLVGYGARFLGNFIGFLYPAYASFKAIETPEKDDDTKWVTYWVVYAFFGVFFEISDLLIFWIPFYDLLKCCFFVWLMLPGESNGSMILYKKVIYPLVQRHESQIDATLEKLKDAATESVGVVQELSSDFRDETTKIASQLTAEAVSKAVAQEESHHKSA